MVIKDHKYKDLAEEIKKKYFEFCSSNVCGGCKYAFQPNCKVLFILDYMEDKKIIKN